MNPIADRPIRTTLFALLLGLAMSCGDEPQRIGKAEPATAAPPRSPHAAMGAAPAPSTTVRLAGRVQLAGSLAKAQSGAIFMIARSGGKTSLVHKYEMNGPFWSAQGDDRVLHFSLTDQDNMAGVGAPVGEKMDLEARYDPDGFVDIKPGSEKKGVVKATTAASIGDSEISITLKSGEEAPPHATPAAKPSGG